MAVDPRKEHDDDDYGDDDGNENDNDNDNDDHDYETDDDSDDDDDFETPRAAQTGGAGLQPLGGEARPNRDHLRFRTDTTRSK